jgi:DNA-binding GntR family transcriptional regulator
MLEPIQPISKKNQVALALKEAILAGTIAPGSPIVESRVAQQLGAGIPLVREALIELEHQGFVQRVPYKGTSVTRLEPEDVRRSFRLRVELEALAVEWAREHVTDEDVEYLRDKIESMKRAAAALDLNQFYECDLAFHRKLWKLSGNPYLVEALERVVVPLFAFFLMKYKRQRETYVESAAAHARLVEALPVKSAAELRELTREVTGGWQSDALTLLFHEEGNGAPA